MLIIAALSIEIAPLINTLKAQKIKAYSNKTALYRAKEHDILVVGVGPAMAERTLLAYLAENKTDYILNAGTAGKMSDDLEIAKVYQVATVRTDNEESLDLELLFEGKGEYCLSLRRALSDTAQRDRSHEEFGTTLADMECYTLAKIAKEQKIPMAAIKVISDFADCGSRDMFKQHIDMVAKVLSDKVLDLLENHPIKKTGNEIKE